MTEIIRDGRVIHLRNDRVSYGICLLEGGIPMHLYFGPRVASLETAGLLRRCGVGPDGGFSVQNLGMDRLPQEYPSFGLGDMRDGALTVRRADGTRSADLRFRSLEILPEKPALEGLPATFGGESATARLTLADELTGLRAELLYTIFGDCDAVARSVRLVNDGPEPLVLERAFSLCLDLPDADWELITLSGAWAREREIVRRPLVPGHQGVGSVLGASGLRTSPFAALVRPGATEERGEVVAAALVYSGNFTAEVEVDPVDTARLLMGIHDLGFAWTLAPGAAFQTPEALLVRSEEGLDGMSRSFHRLCAEHLVRGKYARADRPILLNNWEATYFGFDEEKLLGIARTAAEVGVELFVLDDGWFGRRDDDTTSLGDWTVDRRKLPGGMPALAEKIHALGLRFGLWFEPEMVSPDSDLYRAHPDWAIHIAGREGIQQRNQYVLDLSRPDVQEHVYHAVADMLSSADINYVKWDMNRNFTNIGSACLPPDRMGELPHRYMLGLYGVLERLTADFPEVLFESCASGGGRFDMGMLYYMPQTWCSDNTDAVCRCRIQYGTSMVFPPFSMGSHVSAVPSHQTGRITPLESRANVAMSGCFGFELDLNKLTSEELEEVRAVIRRVKSVRRTLLYGDFHRLLSPFEGVDTAWITVSPDRSEAVFMFLRSQMQMKMILPLVRLRGLDPGARYRVEETGEVYGGDELMHIGLVMPPKRGDAQSVSYILRKVTE